MTPLYHAMKLRRNPMGIRRALVCARICFVDYPPSRRPSSCTAGKCICTFER